MRFTFSWNWLNKRKYRKTIEIHDIEYAIMHSSELKDKRWETAFNAICRIPPSGRILKVAYRKLGKGLYKIITAYWLD
jgi:hypothetical protein